MVALQPPGGVWSHLQETFMTSVPAPTPDSSRRSFYLAANGALLILAGLLCRAAVSAVPYPRLILTTHIQFRLSEMLMDVVG